jgi:6-phosphogluconolactonase
MPVRPRKGLLSTAGPRCQTALAEEPIDMLEVCRTVPAVLPATAARLLAAALGQILQRRPTAVLAVPGGRSAGAILRELAAAAALPWERVHVVLADERIVPLGSAERNFAVVEESLVRPLTARGALPAGNVHPFVLDTAAADLGAGAYGEILRPHGGRVHVVLLSAGEDGHVASLFPGGSVLRDDPGYFIVEDSPKPPPRRLTASRTLLRAAEAAVLVFAGEPKRAAYEAFAAPGAYWADCPAALVKGIPGAWVVTDLVVP